MDDFHDGVKPLFNIRTRGGVIRSSTLALLCDILPLLGDEDPQSRALAAGQLRDIVAISGLKWGAVAVAIAYADQRIANARARVLLP